MASGELDPDELNEANGLRRFADVAIRTPSPTTSFWMPPRRRFGRPSCNRPGFPRHRLRWPASTIVFEVDQPQVIDFKILAGLGAAPTGAVAVDLRDDWPTALQKAGFDSSAADRLDRQGLLGYLSRRAQDGCLARSPPRAYQAASSPPEVLRINRLNEEELRGRSLAAPGGRFQAPWPRPRHVPGLVYFGDRTDARTYPGRPRLANPPARAPPTCWLNLRTAADRRRATPRSAGDLCLELKQKHQDTR